MSRNTKFNSILLSSSINIFISSYNYIMSQKQPENFINATLNKYTIRAFDYEHMFFHKNSLVHVRDKSASELV